MLYCSSNFQGSLHVVIESEITKKSAVQPNTSLRAMVSKYKKPEWFTFTLTLFHSLHMLVTILQKLFTIKIKSLKIIGSFIIGFFKLPVIAIYCYCLSIIIIITLHNNNKPLTTQAGTTLSIDTSPAL